jgi:hypothetical protein
MATKSWILAALVTVSGVARAASPAEFRAMAPGRLARFANALAGKTTPTQRVTRALGKRIVADGGHILVAKIEPRAGSLPDADRLRYLSIDRHGRWRITEKFVGAWGEGGKPTADDFRHVGLTAEQLTARLHELRRAKFVDVIHPWPQADR